MKYEPKDLPSFKQYDEQFKGFDAILKINKLLSKIGLGSKKIQSLEPQFSELQKQKEEFENYSTKYNRYFASDGWIIHDSIDFKVVKIAVNLWEENKFEEAKNFILNNYLPEEIEKKISFIKYIPEFQSRRKFIEYALNDYKEKRYYSCIPLLIMIIDGIVQDIVKIGFHAEKIDLAVWDSITATDTGIQIIKNIFQSSRYKTSNEKITLPFRNGILHGRDLGYDNLEVAAKSWAFLFYVRDWVISKRTESDRIKKYQEENRNISWRDLFTQISSLEETKKAINNWKPREITTEYLDQLNTKNFSEKETPEKMVSDFLEYWNKKNYGRMACFYSSLNTDNYKKYAGEIRLKFNSHFLIDYQFIHIKDDAPSITEIIVRAKLNMEKETEREIKFRCIYEKGKNEPVPRDLNKGQWKIVFIDC